MINNLGKGLVLFTVAASFLFLAWAVAVFTQTVDWGWKDPRKELGERVPSEIDKRIAAVKEALRFKARAEAGAKNAQESLAIAEQDFPRNVLSYQAKLNALRTAPGKIKVEPLKLDKGVLARTDQRATAGPVYEGVVPGAEKSVAGYFADLKKVQLALDAATAQIKELTEKEKGLTETLNGLKDETGKAVKVGMYELVEKEKKTQEQVKAETEYLQPLWVRELVDAQLLIARMGRLNQRLEELKGPAPMPRP
jgi:hypothetical protein